MTNIISSFQVSPTELEGIIATLSSVQDVAVSSVYSNAEGTELPMAYVVPQGMKEAQLAAAVTAVNANGEAEGGGNKGSRTGSTLSPPEELVVLAEKVAKVVEEKCVHYKRLRGGVVIVNGIPKSARCVNRFFFFCSSPLLCDADGICLLCSGKILRSALKDQKGFHVQVYKKLFPSVMKSHL